VLNQSMEKKVGSVAEIFRWDYIDPDQTVGVRVHPYGADEFVAFSINLALRANQPRGAYTSIAAQLTDGPTEEYFGSIARTGWVHNQTVGPQPYITVGLVRFRQRISRSAIGPLDFLRTVVTTGG
jgi:hypothetical protein